MVSKLLSAGLISIGMLLSAEASASLSLFNTWTGNVGYSSDGFGSTSQSGVISASVPLGSTVLGAYLYTGTYGDPSSTYSGTLNGNALTFNNIGVNAASCCQLSSGRVDVTSIVAPIINGGPGGVYNFNLTESSSSQDGEALVVVYSNPALANRTFAMLDGFASVTGDTASINFADPLKPSASGFAAEMFLGINFSCCTTQRSTVSVNGTTITENAGNNDDGLGSISNGQLITVGGYDDGYSSLLPSYENDHERYNLVPYIADGDTSIVIKTSNASRDDNIFLAGFYVTGLAGINEPPPTSTVPEPETYAMFLAGLGFMGFMARRRK